MKDGSLYGILPNKLKNKNKKSSSNPKKSGENSQEKSFNNNLNTLLSQFHKVLGNVNTSNKNDTKSKSKKQFQLTAVHSQKTFKNEDLSSNFKLSNNKTNQKGEKGSKEKLLDELLRKIKIKNNTETLKLNKSGKSLDKSQNKSQKKLNKNREKEKDKEKEKDNKIGNYSRSKEPSSTSLYNAKNIFAKSKNPSHTKKSSVSSLFGSQIFSKRQSTKDLNPDLKNKIDKNPLKDSTNTYHRNSKNPADLLSLLGINFNSTNHSTNPSPTVRDLNYTPTYSNLFNRKEFLDNLNNNTNNNKTEMSSVYYQGLNTQPQSTNFNDSYNPNTSHSKKKSSIFSNFTKSNNNTLFSVNNTGHQKNRISAFTQNTTKPSSTHETLKGENHYLDLPDILKLIQEKNKNKKSEERKKNIISSKNEVELKVNLKKNEYLIKFSNSNIQYNSDKEDEPTKKKNYEYNKQNTIRRDSDNKIQLRINNKPVNTYDISNNYNNTIYTDNSNNSNKISPNKSKKHLGSNKNYLHQETSKDINPKVSIKDQEIASKLNSSTSRRKTILIQQQNTQLISQLKKIQELMGTNKNMSNDELKNLLVKDKKKNQTIIKSKNASKTNLPLEQENMLEIEEENASSKADSVVNKFKLSNKKVISPIKFTKLYESPKITKNIIKRNSFLNKKDITNKDTIDINNKKTKKSESNSANSSLDNVSHLYEDSEKGAKRQSNTNMINKENIFQQKISEEISFSEKSSKVIKPSPNEKDKEKVDNFSKFRNSDYRPKGTVMFKNLGINTKDKTDLPVRQTTLNQSIMNTNDLFKKSILIKKSTVQSQSSQSATDNITSPNKKVKKINFANNLIANTEKIEENQELISRSGTRQFRTMNSNLSNKSVNDLKKTTEKLQIGKRTFKREMTLANNFNKKTLKSKKSLKDIIRVHDKFASRKSFIEVDKKKVFFPEMNKHAQDLNFKQSEESSGSGGKSMEKNTDEEEEDLKKFIKGKNIDIKFYRTDKMDFNEDVGYDMKFFTRKILNDVVENIEGQTDIHEILKQQEINMSKNPVKRFRDYFKLIKKNFKGKKLLKKDSITEKDHKYFTNKNQIEKIKEAKKFNSDYITDFDSDEDTEKMKDKKRSNKPYNKISDKKLDSFEDNKNRYSKETLLYKAMSHFRKITNDFSNKKEHTKKDNLMKILRFGMANIYKDMLEHDTFETKPIIFQLKTKIAIPTCIKRHLLSTYLDIYSKIKNTFYNSSLLDAPPNDKRSGNNTIGLGAPTLFKHFSINNTSVQGVVKVKRAKLSTIPRFDLIKVNSCIMNFTDLRSKNFINSIILRDFENSEEFYERKRSNEICYVIPSPTSKATDFIFGTDLFEIKEDIAEKGVENIRSDRNINDNSHFANKTIGGKSYIPKNSIASSKIGTMLVKDSSFNNDILSPTRYRKTETYKSINIKNFHEKIASNKFSRTAIENAAEDADEEELGDGPILGKHKNKNFTQKAYKFSFRTQTTKIEPEISILKKEYFSIKSKTERKPDRKSTYYKKRKRLNILFSSRKKNSAPKLFDWKRKLFSIDKHEDEFDNILYEKNNTVKGKTNKEAMISKTYQLQSDIVEKFCAQEKLRFYIRDDNYLKFKEVFSREDKTYIEDKDEFGNSLLNLAVQSNATLISAFLIDEGAEVNTQNNKLNSPLHYALCHKNYKISNLLIYKKADEDLTNEKGLTPWQYANINNS